MEMPSVRQTENLKPKKETIKISKKQGWAILIIVVIVLYLVVSQTPLNPYMMIKYPPSKWQAVFLSNNQVYFGKVSKMNRKEISLKEIYYLQTVVQPLQRSAGEEGPAQAEQRLTLVKLGSELHGPEDNMTINKDYIILIENLKGDSRVVEAIERYLTDQAGE